MSFWILAIAPFIVIYFFASISWLTDKIKPKQKGMKTNKKKEA